MKPKGSLQYPPRHPHSEEKSNGEKQQLLGEKKSRKRKKNLSIQTIEEEESEEEEYKARMLLISFIAMIIISMGNRVFQKLQTIPMLEMNHVIEFSVFVFFRHDYPMFLNLLSTFIYVPICFTYIIPMIWSGKISKEQQQIPKHKFLVMGILDAISCLIFQLSHV